MLIAAGYDDAQVARVVGYASSALFDRNDPFNPVNRRIDIVVLTKKAQRNIEGEQGGGELAPDPAPDAPAGGAGGAPLSNDQVRERLNIFEDGTLQMDQPSE